MFSQPYFCLNIKETHIVTAGNVGQRFLLIKKQRFLLIKKRWKIKKNVKNAFFILK